MGSRYTVDTALSRIDLDQVHRWLATYAIGRSRETVQRAAESSLNFGVFSEHGDLVGYARVVTDYATFGWLCDVFVAFSERGRGLGDLLLHAVVDELRPLHLKRVLLSTLDAHGLYERVGFVAFPEPHKLMLLSEHPPLTPR